MTLRVCLTAQKQTAYTGQPIHDSTWFYLSRCIECLSVSTDKECIDLSVRVRTNMGKLAYILIAINAFAPDNMN